jgi:hypothetical protein
MRVALYLQNILQKSYDPKSYYRPEFWVSKLQKSTSPISNFNPNHFKFVSSLAISLDRIVF